MLFQPLRSLAALGAGLEGVQRPELVDDAKRAHAGPWLPDVTEGLYISRDMKQRTQAGCTGRPDLATAAKGAAMFEGIVDRVSGAVRQILDTPIPD
ncbi:MAG: creatininase family protein [Verrucomicrobiales bacterium]